jgi:hypothetical protein
MEALGHFLGEPNRSVERLAEVTGISAEEIRFRPLAPQGFGGSEMLGWLAIHHGPYQYSMEGLIPAHRGDWDFFPVLLKAATRLNFWNGTVV